MSTPNCFLILNIEPDAGPREIRKAYKRLALRFHSDPGTEAEDQFKELKSAYETLIDPVKRRAHERDLGIAGERQDEILHGDLVDMGLDFQKHRPPIDYLLERMLQLFQRGEPKSGRQEKLRVEVILTPREARIGGILPLQVPVFEGCPTCEGLGETFGFECRFCDGRGAVETRRTLPVTIPAGIRDSESFAYDLASIRLPGIVLHVDVRVR